MPVPLLPPVFRGEGLGDGGTAIGRWGPAFGGPFPGRGPGEPSLFGPGEGAMPPVIAFFAPCVGLGLGTPAFVAGAALGRLTGSGGALGATVALTAATATAVGATVGAAVGAGVAGFAVGAAVGAGGRGVGLAVGTTDGTGLGAAVGGTLTATACIATDGIAVGTAGN